MPANSSFPGEPKRFSSCCPTTTSSRIQRSAPVRASADATAEILEAAGFGGVRLIELPDGVPHPAVFGELPGPAGSPTLLLYAHHDVQPEGPLEEWTSPPFAPEVRDAWLYGNAQAFFFRTPEQQP